MEKGRGNPGLLRLLPLLLAVLLALMLALPIGARADRRYNDHNDDFQCTLGPYCVGSTTSSITSATTVESCTTIGTGVVLCHSLSFTTSTVTTTVTSPSTSNSTFAYVDLGLAAIMILVVAALAAWVLRGRRP